ncbi:unnamed protein product [Prunus armeniaca]
MGLQKIIVLSLVAMAMASLFVNADVGVKEAADPFCYETCGPSFGMLQCVQDCARGNLITDVAYPWEPRHFVVVALLSEPLKIFIQKLI